MAQYYPVLSQNDKNSEEITHIYQNIDDTQTIQYVIAADSSQQQFQSQIVDSSEQLMIVEGQQGQQLIIDQSPITYQQSSYIIQDSSTVDFSNNQQVYYTTSPRQQIIVEQPIIQEQPVVLNPLIQNQVSKTVPLTNSHTSQQQKALNQLQQIRNQSKAQHVRQENIITQKGIQMNAQKSNQGMSLTGSNAQNFQGNNSNNDQLSDDEDKLVALSNGTVVSYTQYKKLVAAQKQQQQQFTPERLGQVASNVTQRARAGNMNPKRRIETPQPQIKQNPTAQYAAQRRVNRVSLPPNNAQYLIQPPRPQVKQQQRRSLPEFLHASQIQNIIDNTPNNEEFSDSIRMLVLLENGEQRLITFTLPKEACTIQEILEQVNVPFNQQTPIQVTESNANGLNYIVAVGNVPGFTSEASSEDGDSTRQQASCRSSPVSDESAVVDSSKQTPTSSSPEPPKEPPPKLIEGKLAVCSYCGYLSEDFNRCMRCRRKLPENVKSIPAVSNVGKKVVRGVLPIEKGIGFQKTNGVPRMNLLPKKKVQKPKIMECETVVVSSDDEDSEEKSILKQANESLLEKLSSSVTLSPISKEPSILDIQRHASQSLSARLFEKVPENEIITTYILCRTVRIGSYRFVPPEPIKIDSHSLVLRVPHPKIENIIKVIKIDNINVVKMLVCFQKSLPVLFFYYTPNVGAMVRQALDMTSGSDLYFDPLSESEESYRRVTLLPEILSDESRKVLHRIYYKNQNLIDELSYKEANDILIKTCPKELSRSLKLNSSIEIKSLLMYPPEGQGRITINTEDYLCLAQDQFLNDVIIDFYLKYLVLNLPKEMQDKVHVFSTFFYKRLTTKSMKHTRKFQPSEVDSNLTPAQKRHCRVKNWTKNVNLFEKDFIIVPINENCHWFLAIICFPSMNGSHTMEGQPIKIEPKQTPKKKSSRITLTIPVTSSLEKVPKQPLMCDDVELSDKDEAEGDDSELDSDVEEPPVTLSVENNSQRPPIKQPCILIFDSLAGASRTRVVATLRDYLSCEHKAKLNIEKNYTKDVIKGACPKVPQQTNYTDCGLYLLQYVEQFFNDPIKDYYIPIGHLKTWFEELTVTKKREDISLLIKSLMQECGKDTSVIPDIIFPTINGELAEHVEKEDPFEDPDEDEPIEEEEEEEFLPPNLLAKNAEMHTDSDQTVDSTIKPSSESVKLNNEFVEQTITNTALLKPDFSELRQKNAADLAYLKAKRIVKNKNAGSNNSDEPDPKKIKSNTNSAS